MKCLFGIYHEDEGQVILEGKQVRFDNPRKALENGIAMVHQELNQVQKRNVMENIWLGRFPKRFGLVDHKKIYEDTRQIMNDLKIDVDPKEIVGNLSVSQRQMVEIAKAVSYHSKVIVLDEPTSSLTEKEVEHLFEIIRMLKERGCGIIYISHRMEEILRISDEVTIMRDGQYVSCTPAKELTNETIIRQMVGRELKNQFPPKDNVPGEVILKVENLSALYNQLDGVSFELHKGEILGVAGLAGAGRTELLETIFGNSSRKSGRVEYRGKEVKNVSPKDAIAHKFALVTEERRASGVFGILTLRENATIASIRRYKRGPFVSEKKVRAAAQKMIDAMHVKAASQKVKMMTLSGGNQQKAIVGRWLLTEPEIMLLDEPTRGIDVGAKYEIYQLLINIAKEGKGVLMVSSEMPELLGICDRILVLSGGRLAGEVDPKNTTQEEIMTLAAKYV